MSKSAAEKATATKRKDRGFGRCPRPGCARPAAEPSGECVEHRTGKRAAETLRKQGSKSATAAAKGKDRRFGRCRKYGCKRPAAEPEGLCVAHRAYARANETVKKQGYRNVADKAHATRQRRQRGWFYWTDEEKAAAKKDRAAARKKRWGF